jgi:hypothetical protein
MFLYENSTHLGAKIVRELSPTESSDLGTSTVHDDKHNTFLLYIHGLEMDLCSQHYLGLHYLVEVTSYA